MHEQEAMWPLRLLTAFYEFRSHIITVPPKEPENTSSSVILKATEVMSLEWPEKFIREFEFESFHNRTFL